MKKAIEGGRRFVGRRLACRACAGRRPAAHAKTAGGANVSSLEFAPACACLVASCLHVRATFTNVAVQKDCATMSRRKKIQSIQICASTLQYS